MIRIVPKVVSCNRCRNNIEYEEQDKEYKIKLLRPVFSDEKEMYGYQLFYIQCPVCKNYIELDIGKAKWFSINTEKDRVINQ